MLSPWLGAGAQHRNDSCAVLLFLVWRLHSYGFSLEWITICFISLILFEKIWPHRMHWFFISYLYACEPWLLYVCLLVTEIALIWFLSRMHDHMFHKINIIWESLTPQIALIWFLPSVIRIWMAKYGYIVPFPSSRRLHSNGFRKNESSYVHVGAQSITAHIYEYWLGYFCGVWI